MSYDRLMVLPANRHTNAYTCGLGDIVVDVLPAVWFTLVSAGIGTLVAISEPHRIELRNNQMISISARVAGNVVCVHFNVNVVPLCAF